MGKLLLILPVLLLAAACETTGPRDAGADTSAAPSGRAIYEHSCQRCHALYMPSSFEPGEWRFFVRKYGRKARLDPREKALVLEYLVRNSNGRRAELASGASGG